MQESNFRFSFVFILSTATYQYHLCIHLLECEQRTKSFLKDSVKLQGCIIGWLEGDRGVGKRGTYKHFLESSNPTCSKQEKGFGGGLNFPDWMQWLYMIWWHTYLVVTNFNV